MTSAPNITLTPEKEQPKPPSIKETLMNPRYMLFGLIFSAVINIVLLVSLIIVASNSGTRTATNAPVTSIQPSNTPAVTAKPSPRPTFTPNETLLEFQECFHNCSVEELLNRTRSKALTYSNFKANIFYQDNQNKQCYGNYLESSNEFREFNSYRFQDCPDGYLSRLPQTSIQITDNIYYLNNSGNWDLDSKPRISQTKLIRVIDEVIPQQEKEFAEVEGKNQKKIVTTSKTVNDVNQLVTKTANLVVSEYLDVLSYEIEVTNISKETGYFFGFGEANIIQAPI